MSCPRCGGAHTPGSCPSYSGTVALASTESQAMAAEPPSLIGTVVDRYRIEALLGKGGMGVVYRAVHSELGRPFAFKVLTPGLARNSEMVERFRREARAASSIGHDGIVYVSDFGEHPDVGVYFVMEMLEGESLDERLELEGALLPRDLLDIATQVADAVSAAHEAGVLHRDLKPENIFLARKRRRRNVVKVLDFGIAVLQGEVGRLTTSGQVMGTPQFMSPEQCHGAEIDARSDIYSLGCVFYRMATGELLFDADQPLTLLNMQANVEPDPPSVRCPHIELPDGFEPLLMSMLDKDPEGRPQTMAAVFGELQDIAAGAFGGDRRQPPSESTDVVDPLPQSPPKRKPFAIAAAVALVGAVLAVVLVTQRGGDDAGEAEVSSAEAAAPDGGPTEPEAPDAQAVATEALPADAAPTQPDAGPSRIAVRAVGLVLDSDLRVESVGDNTLAASWGLVPGMTLIEIDGVEAAPETVQREFERAVARGRTPRLAVRTEDGRERSLGSQRTKSHRGKKRGGRKVDDFFR